MKIYKLKIECENKYYKCQVYDSLTLKPLYKKFEKILIRIGSFIRGYEAEIPIIIKYMVLCNKEKNIIRIRLSETDTNRKNYERIINSKIIDPITGDIENDNYSNKRPENK